MVYILYSLGYGTYFMCDYSLGFDITVIIHILLLKNVWPVKRSWTLSGGGLLDISLKSSLTEEVLCGDQVSLTLVVSGSRDTEANI